MTSSPPTSVRSRSLVPGPSASNGAPSFHRTPVTALPRSTTPVPGGIALLHRLDELLEPLLAPAKGQADDVLSLLLSGELICRAGGSRASSAIRVFRLSLGATDGPPAYNSRLRMRTATVVGAGVFGAWTAHALKERGWSVTLIDQHGPASSRASSGGETRIIRSGYGALAVYARWARDSLPQWLALELTRRGTPVRQDGGAVPRPGPGWLAETEATLRREDDPLRGAGRRGPAPPLSAAELRRCEGRLRACRRCTVRAAGGAGAGARPGRRGRRVDHRRVDPAVLLGEARGDAVIFAAGAWLPRLFPDLLADVIFPTRQEVFFFGPPPGDTMHFADAPAGVGRVRRGNLRPARPRASRHQGGDRRARSAGRSRNDGSHRRRGDSGTDARGAANPAARLSADAPLLESRVCQYENTTDGHFLLDRLPGHDRAWIVGGGSGHGFKHGPAVGRHVADLVEGRIEPDPVFQLAGRPPRARAVF